MLSNYFTLFLRNLRKNSSYSILNIAGLALGIACASMIFLWVENEVSANHNYPNHDHLYTIYENQTYEGKISTFHATPGLMAETIQKEIPGVKRAARLSSIGPQLFALGDKSLRIDGASADPAIFPMLELPMTAGNATKPFDNQLHAIVISERMAHQFFGEANPIGKTLNKNNEQDYTITAVFKDLPDNSTLQFAWLTPMANVDHKYPWMQYWGANWARTYLELEPTANVAQVDQKIRGLIAKELKSDHPTIAFLFPMNDWNLRDSFTDGHQDGGRIIYVRLFSLIAWIILLIACINFMNLATARSEQRAKEVGVRKVMGAAKGTLVGQFIGEALFLTFIAVALAVLMTYAALPPFNRLIEKSLRVDLLSPLHLAYLLAIGTVTGLIAGSYPALFLSSFNPVAVLKGIRLKSAAGHGLIRKGLVVTQFSISIVLICATMIIYRQIAHVKGRDLGYNKNNLLYIPFQDQLGQHYDQVYTDLKQTGLVENAAISDDHILEIGTNTSNFKWKGKDPARELLVSWENVSTNFFATTGMHLLAGRDFYPGYQKDSNSIVINEALAKAMGKEGRIGGTLLDGGDKPFRIVGIIQDYFYNSMYDAPGAELFFNNPSPIGNLNIRFKAGVNLPDGITRVQQIVKAANPAYPVEFKFVDDEFNRLFHVESLTGQLAGIFASLAIAISCLGLLGLAAYTAERRRREIGIRKVLGASISGLARLLSGEFLRLVALSCLIAFPVAWWLMHNWLQNFTYHTTITWQTFAAAGIGAMGIAGLTVSVQAIRAAFANPINNLRSE
jgi:putative ABC transport system permease protein